MNPKFKLTGPPVLREKDVVRACIDLLNIRGYKAFRQQVGRMHTPDGRTITVGDRGDPDYVVLHGRLPGFCLEVKRPGGKLRPMQAFRRQQLQTGWGLAFAVVDSVEALAEFLKEHEAR